MASINQASKFLSSSPSTSYSSYMHRNITRASIQFPNIRVRDQSTDIPKIKSTKGFLVEEQISRFPKTPTDPRSFPDHEVMEKLYTIMEAISDRVEMHKNVGEQRNNWNSLLLTSINTITLAATTMVAIASAASVIPNAPLVPLNLASSFMFLAATAMLTIMNKIQPSQLVEEQRNAARLFKHLETEIQTKMSIGDPTHGDVTEGMEKVLALDRAYPLPLIGVMLEKFPSKVEPAVWWPKQRRMATKARSGQNGWSVKLEEEMREVVKILEVKDKADYLRLGEKALKLHKGLAVAGPLLTGLGAVGSVLMMLSPHNPWAMVLGVMGGAVGTVVNSVQHGGQVGMVFEMYRSNAGFFMMMQESIELNLEEKDVEFRENGEVFEMKVALQLGRSLSELRDVAASSSTHFEEFGSKLF
ncbi:hypothetical protein SSX86_028433 [Deinandra increscens subsp. villosa]|uniref:F-box protein n=1 Tax=Deinandra increscens subsp. villosa TaxID=3103831 RepID=A0AAP0C8R1_9ASTR